MKLFRLGIAVAVILAFAATSGTAKAQVSLQSWLKTMTTDPETNFPLRKYGEKSNDPATQYYNTLSLFALMLNCVNVKVDKSAWNRFKKDSNFESFTQEQRETGKFQSGRQMHGMDGRDFFHLCAGGTYLFGPNGTLIKGGLVPSGRPLTLLFDPNNPYIAINPDDPEQIFQK